MLATEARVLSESKLRLGKILTFIKVTAEKGWFQISYRLHKDEIKQLQELGYKISGSNSLSTISWLPKYALKSKVEMPKTKTMAFRHNKQSLICCGKIPTAWKKVRRAVADVDGMVTIKYKSYKCGVCKKAVMPIGNFIAPNRMHSKRFIKMAVRLMKESGCLGAATLIKQTTGITVDGSTIYGWKQREDYKL